MIAKPNKHGVYEEPQCEVIRVTAGDSYANLIIAETGKGYKAGICLQAGDGGSSGLPSTRSPLFLSRDEAIAHAIDSSISSLESHRACSCSDEAARSCSRLIKALADSRNRLRQFQLF